MEKVSPKKKRKLFHENRPIKESTDNLDIRVVFKGLAVKRASTDTDNTEKDL